MAGHGGARTGAGRPKGGISQTRRLLEIAITEGLAHAGRSKYPEHMTGQLEEDAVRTGAMIVSDMINSGDGKDVVKLWAAISTGAKESNPGSGSGTLADALSALPSLPDGANMPQETQPETETAEDSDTYEACATDNGLVAPQNGTFFTPQQGLLVDVPALEYDQVMDDGQSGSDTPHPPLGDTVDCIYPDTKNFENSESRQGGTCPDAEGRFG
ncbi:hypothetical protein NX722_23535 [Endozoicomonas gorgoniicola]|uniref:Uncharacterized protein n=1 Tax=Endozoicomonas gorgoniicola TaxID=1234144 RepID=A0ABT3N1N7_9GAMM|nr:hypothetical protein [Endozoicomonas gorgoniicola]MCW7555540.1 hypothetical protein [Endozoicomonas gorgoniicola]